MPGVILTMKLMVIVKLENIQPPWFICVTKCSFIGRYIEKINIKFFQKAQKIAYRSVNICIIYFELYFWYLSWFSIRHFKTFTLYEWLSLLLKLYFSMISLLWLKYDYLHPCSCYQICCFTLNMTRRPSTFSPSVDFVLLISQTAGTWWRWIWSVVGVGLFRAEAKIRVYSHAA